MKVKLKSTLVLVATLILGMVIGSVFTGRLMHSRSSERWKSLRSPEGFIERFYDKLEIRPEQKADIEPILQDYFTKMKENSQKFRRHFREVQDSLPAHLKWLRLTTGE